MKIFLASLWFAVVVSHVVRIPVDGYHVPHSVRRLQSEAQWHYFDNINNNDNNRSYKLFGVTHADDKSESSVIATTQHLRN